MAFVNENKKEILATIDGWQGSLTYDALVDELQRKLDLKEKPSRHTLTSYDEIKHAFNLKKQELRDKKTQSIEDAKALSESPQQLSDLLKNVGNDNATIVELAKRAEKLERENQKLFSESNRLETANNILLERFTRWQHNLQKMDGVDLNKLMANIDTPLSEKDIR